jgi:hypothetical protein
MNKNSRPRLLRLAGLLIFWLAARPSESAIFSTIITNGPATNRINLVFFSEGYTNGQMANFLNDATNAANAFFSVQPYAEYTGYFNVFAIFTNSAHAGSTHLISVTNPPGYTCFNSTYDNVSDYLITIPPNTVDANNLDGQGKINSLLQFYLPGTNNNLPALLVNDVIYGGSDGGSSDYGKTAICAMSDFMNYILVHESGHTLGGLGDEYSNPYPGFPNVEEPNTTTNSVLSLIKWNAWIPTNTPIPTPATVTYEYTVGLFQGAHYHATGWYRPYYDCCMKSFDLLDFCPVCQEALVLAIYGKARPLDARSPATNSLNVTSAQKLAFSLNLLQPATHPLNVQWRTNNIAVVGATNPVFYLWPSQFGNGTNKVEADVWDATAWVRTDGRNVLKQTNVWTLNVTQPVMQIDSVKALTNRSFMFRVAGTAPDGVVIQMSTNLLQWTPVLTNFFSGGYLFYTNSITGPKRFYRAQTPP